MRSFNIYAEDGSEPFGSNIPEDSSLIFFAKYVSGCGMTSMHITREGIYNIMDKPYTIRCMGEDVKIAHFVDKHYTDEQGRFVLRATKDGADGFWEIDSYESLEDARAEAQRRNEMHGITEDWAELIWTASVVRSCQKEGPVKVAKDAIDIIDSLIVEATCGDNAEDVVRDIIDEAKLGDVDVCSVRDTLVSLGSQCTKTEEGREWLSGCYPALYKAVNE